MNAARYGRSSPESTSAMQRWLAEQAAAGMGTGARSGIAMPQSQATTDPSRYMPGGSNAAYAAPVQQTVATPAPSPTPETGTSVPAVNEPMQPPNPMAAMAGIAPMAGNVQQPSASAGDYLFWQGSPLSAYAMSTGMMARMGFR